MAAAYSKKSDALRWRLERALLAQHAASEAGVAIPCREGGSEAPELAPCFFPELELF
jgi:hypothetical protein